MTNTYVRKKIRASGDIPKKDILRWLDIELTERCNNNCIHCSINIPENDPKISDELKTDEWKQYIKEAAELGCKTVRITGGEPLLRTDFPEIYIFIKKLGMSVTLFTNATLITDETGDILSRYPPGNDIEITLYGMKRGSYEGISKVSGSFDKAWRGVDILKKRNIPFIVKSVFLPPNKNELYEFIEWARSVPRMRGKSPQISMIYNLRSRIGSDKKNKLIRSARIPPDQVAGFMRSSGDDYIKEMKRFFKDGGNRENIRIFSCGAGSGTGSIDPYGIFQPCILVRHPDAVYDLRRGSIEDALIRFFPDLRKGVSDNKDFLSKCAKCFLRPICEQCPGKAWSEHGTLDSPVEYLCDITHAQARDLGLLSEVERGWEIADSENRIERFLSKKL